MPVINEIGNRYGKLLVLKRAENNVYGDAQWLCQCDCGNQVIVKGGRLRRGQTKSCGCLRAETMRKISRNSIEDLTGQQFGRLTVVERIFDEKGKSKWLCQCECGSKVAVPPSNLKNGTAKSCGCLKSEGEYAIAKYLSSHNYIFKREFAFNDLRKINHLKFDFAIFDNKNQLQCLIEYDGPQHNYYTGWIDINKIKENDEIKTEYCKNHHIPLYRIHYSENIVARLEQIFQNDCHI